MNIQSIQLSARIQNGISFCEDLRDRVVKTVDSIFQGTVFVCFHTIEAILESPYFAAAFVLTVCNISTPLTVCCIVGMAFGLILKMEP